MLIPRPTLVALATALALALGCGRQAVTAPSLPADAPALAAQVTTPAAPPAPRDAAALGEPEPEPDDPTCAGTGDDDVPLDCVSAEASGAPSAQRPVARAKVAGRAADGLPRIVDHRADGTEGPVRHQGKVGNCTAVALAAAVDHAVARGGGPRSPPVSVMHLWSRYHRAIMRRAIEANVDQGVTSDEEWPYAEREACSWVRRTQCAKKRGCHIADVKCGATPDTARLASADQRPVVRLLDVTRLDTDDPTAWREALARGQDILMTAHIDGAKMKRGLVVREFGHVVPDFDARQGGGHSFVLAGYRVETDGTYYLVHNSWGPGWGDGGYAWIGEQTLLTNARSAFLVDATASAAAPADPQLSTDPSSLARLATRSRHTIVHCKTGRLPDALTQKCAEACADGGPRLGDACADTGPLHGSPCAAGELRVAGRCVTASSAGRGADDASGISWTCGATGCAYTIPEGQPGCAHSRKGVCQHSCPAPSYLLTIGGAGVSCSE